MNQELKRIVRKAITEHLIFHKPVDSKEDRIDLICEQVAEEFYQAWDDARVNDVCKKGGLDLKKMDEKLNEILQKETPESLLEWYIKGKRIFIETDLSCLLLQVQRGVLQGMTIGLDSDYDYHNGLSESAKIAREIMLELPSNYRVLNKETK